MGAGKRKTKPTSTTTAQPPDEVSTLRSSGNKLFGQKEYSKALSAYDQALRLLNPGHGDIPLLHSNKAACHMMVKRYKEAVNECTAALEAQPNYGKALVRRSKAYEHMGLYKQALSDVQKSNKAGEATPESLEAEKRLKDILTGKRPNGAIATANGAPARAGGQRRQQPVVFQAKIEFEGEKRALNLTSQCTYSELLYAVHDKFPGSGPIVLKYLDRESDLVTITDRLDIQRALAELVDQAERDRSSAGSRPGALPPLNVHAVRVQESEVPRPPAEEESAFKQIQMARKYLQQEALKQQQQEQRARGQQGAPQEEQAHFEVEQWILDFAMLFRDHTNIDPDKHLDLQTQGWEKLNRAVEATIADEKALPLFEAAADKFLEVTATGLMQMGNVYIALGRRYMDEAADKEDLQGMLPKIKNEFTRAEGRFREALSHKGDFYDAAVGLGQLEYERGKVAAGYVTKPVKIPPVEEGQPPRAHEQNIDLQQKATVTAQREALKNITAENLQAAEPHFKTAVEWYQKAIAMLPEEERAKPIKQPIQSSAEPDEEVNFYAQTLVLWGNLLYEQSQLTGAAGQDGWKPQIEEAIQKFTSAGCALADIRTAMLSHVKADDLDIPELPAEPKVEQKAAASQTAGSEGKSEKVKGLPALGPKPKAKKPEASAAGSKAAEDGAAAAEGGSDAASAPASKAETQTA